MADWNKISAFMATVVPWPASPSDAGWVNLQNSYVDRKTVDGKKNGKYPVSAGKPFKNVSDLVSRAAWINTTAQFKDVWYCTSLQTHAKNDPFKAGQLKAVRSSANAMKLKAIWADVDVKPNGYTTLAEALKALLEFSAKVGLPAFSALVSSGNGLHAYWISDVDLSPAEWAPFAHGLKALLLQEGVKCDAGLTTDQARILRVPGTFNHKSDPPKPVELLDVPLVCYNFETQLSFLKSITPVQGVPAGGTRAPQSIFADGADMASFKVPAVIKIVGEPGLEAGIDKFDDVLLPIGPIFKQCGFYSDALKNGGAEYDQPLWMLSILGATFMENGNAVAHAISQGHATYTAADTQALYDRKVAERADRGIGYPSCAAIAGSGCKACATCPLLAKGKSPLNIRPPITVTVTGPPQSPAAAALKLPPTYEVNDAGLICKIVEKTLKDGETEIKSIPLFQTKLSAFWAQKHPDRLNYTVEVDKGHTHMASVSAGEISKQGFRAYLMNEARTLINLAGALYLEEFYLSMLGKLWDEAAAQEALPFGWFEEQGSVTGFCYGGVVRKADGSVRPCGVGDVNVQRSYTPTGDINTWHDACRTVTDRRRPELTSLMLIGFAAPLLKAIGHNGVIYSVYGDSGSGKSSAYKVGMSIWGHPLTTKGSERSTLNNVTTQMKEIRNLPFYWDEISDDAHRERCAKITHEVTDGVEKGRNLSGQKTQERGTWHLPIVLASNGSFRDFLIGRNDAHAATVVRVLEWTAKKIDTGPGQMDDTAATQVLAKLDSNYGRMGEYYSAWLATHWDQIKTDVTNVSLQVSADFLTRGLPLGNAERYWKTGATIMILAARYARTLGVDVDENDIRDFIYSVIVEQFRTRDRRGMKDGVVDNTEVYLNLYLKDRHAEERVIWTNYMHNVPGRPPKAVMLVKQPTQPRNMAGGIVVRVAIDNREVVIAGKDFTDWLKEKKAPIATVYDGLERDFGAVFYEKMKLLSGTTFGVSGLREPTIVLPVAVPLHPLWDFVWQFSAPGEREAAEAGAAPPVVTTGLLDA